MLKDHRKSDRWDSQRTARGRQKGIQSDGYEGVLPDVLLIIVITAIALEVAMRMGIWEE